MGGFYTLIVACLLLFLAFFAAPQPPAQPPVEPPEEDASYVKKEYSFNPLQAQKEVKIGQFYLKKGAWKAAALRFEEALKWNPADAAPWLLLGDARAKLKDARAAREAYAKYLELAPDAKDAPSVKKRMDALK